MKREVRYSLHHTTAVHRQSVESIIDVSHFLGTPQPLCHSTGTRPESNKTHKIVSSDMGVKVQNHVFYEFIDEESHELYQSLGVRLVPSTYSPHKQASPPTTSFFCASVPVLKFDIK